MRSITPAMISSILILGIFVIIYSGLTPPSLAPGGVLSCQQTFPDKSCSYAGVGTDEDSITKAYRGALSQCAQNKPTCFSDQTRENEKNKRNCKRVSGCNFDSSISESSCVVTSCQYIINDVLVRYTPADLSVDAQGYVSIIGGTSTKFSGTFYTTPEYKCVASGVYNIHSYTCKGSEGPTSQPN